MADYCIYCGKEKAEEKDHVPPKCFFSTPRPTNLLTVPSCSRCNREYGKDDERVRNLLVSLNTTENHNAIRTQLAGKRDRSYTRGKGSNLEFMLSSMKLKDVYSPSGAHLGQAYAFDFDKPIMNRFMSRMVRGLLFHHNGIQHFYGAIEWHFAPDFTELSERDKRYFSSGVSYQVRDIFRYAGYYFPGKAKSLWLMRFFGGIEFMVAVADLAN